VRIRVGNGGVLWAEGDGYHGVSDRVGWIVVQNRKGCRLVGMGVVRDFDLVGVGMRVRRCG
jgi:hypothetical protein